MKCLFQRYLIALICLCPLLGNAQILGWVGDTMIVSGSNIRTMDEYVNTLAIDLKRDGFSSNLQTTLTLSVTMGTIVAKAFAEIDPIQRTIEIQRRHPFPCRPENLIVRMFYQAQRRNLIPADYKISEIWIDESVVQSKMPAAVITQKPASAPFPTPEVVTPPIVETVTPTITATLMPAPASVSEALNEEPPTVPTPGSIILGNQNIAGGGNSSSNEEEGGGGGDVTPNPNDTVQYGQQLMQVDYFIRTMDPHLVYDFPNISKKTIIDNFLLMGQIYCASEIIDHYYHIVESSQIQSYLKIIEENKRFKGYIRTRIGYSEHDRYPYDGFINIEMTVKGTVKKKEVFILKNAVSKNVLYQMNCDIYLKTIEGLMIEVISTAAKTIGEKG